MLEYLEEKIEVYRAIVLTSTTIFFSHTHKHTQKWKKILNSFFNNIEMLWFYCCCLLLTVSTIVGPSSIGELKRLKLSECFL